MKALVTFTPTANVTVEDDGSLTLEIDWSQSCIGEWNEEKLDHFDTPLAERVCNALPALPGVTTIQLAGPGAVAVDPEVAPEPTPAAPPTAAELAAAIDNILASWEHGDLAGAVNAARELVEEARAFQATEAGA